MNSAFPQQAAHRDAYATPEHVQAGAVTGIGYAVSVATGKPIPVYMNDTPPPPAPAPLPVPAASPTVVVHQPRQIDPITTRIAAGSAGLVATAAIAGHYAHQLAEVMHVAEGAAGVIGAAAVAVTLLKGTAPKVSVQINSTITGATSHSASTSSSRSASGWKPSS